MIKSRHKTKTGPRAAGSILRRWNAGYRIETIAFELDMKIADVIPMLVASGINPDRIAVRMRERSTGSLNLPA